MNKINHEQIPPIEQPELKKEFPWITIAIGVVVILVILIIVGIFSSNNSSETYNKKIEAYYSTINIPSNTISSDLAEFVAINTLPNFFTTSRNKVSLGDYESIGYLTTYDMDGLANSYIFIFIESGFKVDTLNKFEESIKGMNSDDRLRYYFEDVITIIIGAKDTEDKLWRAYRGLPEIFVEKYNLEKSLGSNYSNKDIEIGRIISSGPGRMDYEVKPFGLETMGNAVSGDWYLINPKDKELIPASEKIKSIEDFHMENANSYASMSDSDLESIVEGDLLRIENNLNSWEYSRSEMDSF